MKIKIVPCNKFSDVGEDKQLLKIVSELAEVIKASESGNIMDCAHECADLATAAVSHMRFVLGFSEKHIKGVFNSVNEKNKRRGYHS